MPPHTIISVPVQTTAGFDRSLIGGGGSSTVAPGGMSVYTSASPSERSSNTAVMGSSVVTSGSRSRSWITATPAATTRTIAAATATSLPRRPPRVLAV